MPRRTGRTAAAAAAVILALVLPLSGCGSARPIAADAAVDHYDQVARQVREAMDTVRPLQWEHRGQSVRPPENGECLYDPGVWQADDELYPVPGKGMDWEPWRSAIDPVLEDHGFSALGREQRAGSELRLESTDGHGALLRVTAQGELMIAQVRVDADPCEDAALGL